MSDGWALYPYDARHRHDVAGLWEAALSPAWPPLPGAIDPIAGGFVAVGRGGRLAGFVGVDPAGSIPLVLVDPGSQRQGVGTALVAAAVEHLTALGVREVRAGSGGNHYIWPGVPHDLPGAAAFFAAVGWRDDRTTLDLTLDLRGYAAPAGTYDRVAGNVRVTVASADELAEVLAFEAETFPNWLRWFSLGGDMVTARDGDGRIIGALLFSGPGTESIYAPLLGSCPGLIGCVGVAPHAEGRGVGTAMVALASQVLRDRGTQTCHIGWTERERFYSRLGYRPWRRYRMFRQVVE